MPKLSTSELKALTVIWKSSKGLDAFSFFRRLDISFSDFSKTIRLLSEKKLIKEEHDDFFVITAKGIELAISSSSDKKRRSWRDIPERFLAPKMASSELYIPSISLLDKKFFS
ncbi:MULTISPECIES: hypothetical protein [unclassified Vibrio]|uniref:hypothetical protein n=1 Tax=unclassified Vibrio TaxID=2614977 RepID=UPI0035509EC2